MCCTYLKTSIFLRVALCTSFEKHLSSPTCQWLKNFVNFTLSFSLRFAEMNYRYCITKSALSLYLQTISDMIMSPKYYYAMNMGCSPEQKTTGVGPKSLAQKTWILCFTAQDSVHKRKAVEIKYNCQKQMGLEAHLLGSFQSIPYTTFLSLPVDNFRIPHLLYIW
jgi:hypothetical protein